MKTKILIALALKNILLGTCVYYIGKRHGEKMYKLGCEHGIRMKEMETELSKIANKDWATKALSFYILFYFLRMIYISFYERNVILMKELTKWEKMNLGRSLMEAKVKVLLDHGFSNEEIANICFIPEEVVRKISQTKDWAYKGSFFLYFLRVIYIVYSVRFRYVIYFLSAKVTRDIIGKEWIYDDRFILWNKKKIK